MIGLIPVLRNTNTPVVDFGVFDFKSYFDGLSVYYGGEQLAWNNAVVGT